MNVNESRLDNIFNIRIKNKKKDGELKFNKINFINFLSKHFKSLDMYGHIISVNYKGDKTYNSYIGAFLSILTYIFTFGSIYFNV
jgi:hypothetical protein